MGARRSGTAIAAGQSVGSNGVRHSRLRTISTGNRVTQALGRVVATERKPNTPHEFHFWTALDSPVGIGTIVRVDGRRPVNGQIPRVYGIVTEGLSYTDLLTPMHDVLSHDGSPERAGFASAERAEIRLYS